MTPYMELVAVEATIENEIQQGLTQKQVAETYAMAITSSYPTDWRRVNSAITKRWPKGLMRVKNMAWASLKRRRATSTTAPARQDGSPSTRSDHV